MQSLPEVHFARTDDDVTIGYQIFGNGPVLVWMPSLSNILAQWRIPALRSAYLELARHLTVVLYDGRGMGTSDRRIDLGDLGVDAHLRDLHAVLDAAGIARASLLGYYHSVTTAIAFAARSPGRVDRMVLFGGAPRLREAMRPAQTQALLSLVEQDWGLFADAAATAWLGWDAAPSGRWVAEAFRTATTAPVAKAWFGAAERIDVSDEVGLVRAPALVLHRQGDQQIPVEVFRRLAERLPDARLVELPGSTPTLFIEDAAADLRLVTGFVGGGVVGRPAVVADVLTPREREVLALLAAGDANLEIARRLGIAVHTVERHLANLYRKIGARGRTDAVAYAIRRSRG
ncbi:alpha/beta fold hydrolase [Actinoplanes awajinensis]|uniref:LuxR family transcriptional regulator n=1 Tax=Actinoplanes awajinensis subsp. mycoplanecinus TaxID=135947 RepID=A0A101J913_9ACTN|nr:alpha/beta fold hydrolase [Actinoplanes awajinensis]KUL22441.1 LuxR family transcriptional regulator [Actinoplanes awajinensis subsp. mycoplanecinus]